MTKAERKKNEAVSRMKQLKMYQPLIDEFAENGMVEISEPPLGACYWLSDEQKKFVEEFEKRNNALVYHVILSVTNFGKMESYLFVSDYPEEWKYERNDLEDGIALAYVRNLDMPDCSEMGCIGIVLSAAGGLRRTS